MNSLQRVMAAVKFQETDRVPVIAQVFGHAGTLAGVCVDDYVQDGETLARCQLAAWRHYGYDAVFSVMDANVETEALGSILRHRRNTYPVVEKYALSPQDDPHALSFPDPLHTGRMPEMLKALGILREEIGERVPVVGCVMGPMTLTTQLLGMETALYMAIDDPVRFGDLMDFATEVIVRFGLAQLRSGAHLPILFDPCASPAVIPPDFFREFELPRLHRLFEAFTGAGAPANWLHIPGPTGPILSCFAQAGVHIANFDYCVSAEKARSELPATCLDGNVKPILFVEGRAPEIEAESAALLRTFRDRGGFILSSGCEIPPESRPENISAMVNTTRSKVS
jgi:uroporphyrinogen decarboxylase